MVIYGVALLAFCYITGVYIGDILGAVLGVKANVGGVGFAMLLLIILSNKGIDKGWLDAKSQEGIAFWSAMYIPIVVAMSSSECCSGSFWRKCCIVGRDFRGGFRVRSYSYSIQK